MPDPSDTLAAVVRTLVMYALAEAQAGHARTIQVTTDGAAFSVADDGRGHPLAREVEGTPYLQLVYTHLDHPFGAARGAPVQLQGLGLSLINTLCSELTSIVRKPDATLRLRFEHGRLVEKVLSEGPSAGKGNLLTGKLRAGLAGPGTDAPALRAWLKRVQAASAGVRISFNGEPVA